MESIENIYSLEKIAKQIINFCIDKYKFVFISGNGGAGKTTISKILVSEIIARGFKVNCIDMDEFVLDTKLRKSAKKIWIDVNNNTRESEYTTSFRESYYLGAPEVIIHSISKGKNCFFKPKKSKEFVEVKTDARLTIIEGVGSAFLDKNPNAFGVFIMCDRDIEVNRRIRRARDGEQNLSREEVERRCIERNDQFEAIILPERGKFDLELSSLEDYNLKVERDNFGIIR